MDHDTSIQHQYLMDSDNFCGAEVIKAMLKEPGKCKIIWCVILLQTFVFRVFLFEQILFSPVHQYYAELQNYSGYIAAVLWYY